MCVMGLKLHYIVHPISSVTYAVGRDCNFISLINAIFCSVIIVGLDLSSTNSTACHFAIGKMMSL